ncbi:hypothetical protein HETIRDRAFT_328917 [Heterobasidion irregulare TC 32-1]|uniref:Uncharacterized protein n=1 Tax=Heterobasidion irregulare (strain TC 32-1) TaxID=747525 RepID=W4JVF5_HETIT|nr:uncharacterized protein HETIRDRAFT_328917 [Heterobasidion irregulare TC 32-1]ETW76836.1 hypothetical protein HETIRDRAFT_328917 [Heterobasidion irregulare TC 32-1]
MPVLITSNTLQRTISRTINEWTDTYGMSPIQPSSIRFYDQTPPSLKPLADGPHRWLFEAKQSVGYDGRAGLNIRSIVKLLQSHRAYNRQPLLIPEDWKNADSNTDVDSVITILQNSVCHYIDHLHTIWPSTAPVEFYKPRSYFSTVPYPFPNVTLHELRDPQDVQYSVEWTILKILSKAHMGVVQYSTLGVTTFYDALLPAICYQIRGCEVLRSTPITFPPYSAEYGSSTCLDFVCRPSSDNLPNGLPSGFIPVLFAAHHLDALHTFTEDELSWSRPGPPEKMPDRSQELVKLAQVFQPSLQLLVMYLTKKYRVGDQQWKPEWNPIIAQEECFYLRPQIPENFFFYGMNYSQVECIIYAFFPRYEVTSSGRVEWGFCCYEAYTPWPTGGGNLTHRIHFINTILRIQRHTAELAELFREISLSLGTNDICRS